MITNEHDLLWKQQASQPPMGTVINLRQARKNKARTEKEQRAEANRARFGLTKAEKTKLKFEAEKLKRHLDGHKKEGTPPLDQDE